MSKTIQLSIFQKKPIVFRKSQMLTKDIYAKLTLWQVSQISCHPQRPYTLDYISQIFTDFHELHGDRAFADDR